MAVKLPPSIGHRVAARSPCSPIREGRQIFADALIAFAEQDGNPRLTAVIRRLAAPVQVVVRGRDGVGRRTVSAALAASGLTVTSDGSAADVDAVVIAEVLKPEDRALLRSGRPAVVVLNKADLSGFGAGGPVARAHRRAADYRALTAVPTVPMIALLAQVHLDEELIAALRTLADQPADLTSTDAFMHGPHPLAPPLRARLLATLDRFGIAHAVVALGEGADAAALPDLLRRLSQVDRVAEHVDAAAAPVRYRRIRAAITQLRALAAQSGDERLARFLASDDAVLGVMTAAVHVVEAAGVEVDRGDDAAAHLRRARHWRQYGCGPVDPLHRACAADITRGSLRLLGRSQ